MSGHADRDHLLSWIGAFEKKPKRMFVVHGEDQVTDSFAAMVSEQLGMEAVAPYSGDVFPV